MTTPSGPGQFSQRTDKAVGNANANLPNAQYGENKDYQDMKSAAPMAAGGGATPDASQMSMQQLFAGMGGGAVPLSADSTMPNTPVTDGAALGPGAGTEAIASPPPVSQDDLKASLVALNWMANRPDRSDAVRNALMKANAELGLG